MSRARCHDSYGLRAVHNVEQGRKNALGEIGLARALVGGSGSASRFWVCFSEGQRQFLRQHGLDLEHAFSCFSLLLRLLLIIVGLTATLCR
jgi:hypothetical protein